MQDAIIREVRANRERLVEEQGGLAGLFSYLKRKEAEHPERLATPRLSEPEPEEGEAKRGAS